MSSWRQQALIEAPVEDVWELVGIRTATRNGRRKSSRSPAWPQSTKGETFQQVTKTPIGKDETTFEIEELDELHEIKLRCQTSGFYSRWLLTEAQENTFLDVEIGMDPATVPVPRHERDGWQALVPPARRELARRDPDGRRTTR